MSYKAVTAQNTQGTASLLSTLWSFLATTGWTLHDNQDGSNYRVYKWTNDGTQAPVYVRIAFDGGSQYQGGGETDANKIYFCVYHYWNATSHTGTAKVSIYPYLYTTSESGFFYWLYGSPWGCVLVSKVSGVYYFVVLAGVESPVWGTNTTLSAVANSGSDVVLSLTDSTGFTTDRDYQIVGVEGEGREKVTVTAVGSNQITVSSLAGTYAAGAFIGEAPSTFIINSPTGLATFYLINGWNASGTSDSSITATYAPIWGSAGVPSVQSDSFTDRWGLCGYFFYDNGLIGSPPEFVLYVALDTEFGLESVVYPDEVDSGTSSGSNTASTLNDTTKTWTVDEHVGKYVMIYGGAGYSEIRKITSNTATQLVVTTNWSETPDGTSLYRIVDYAYRFFDAGSHGIALKEGSDV